MESSQATLETLDPKKASQVIMALVEGNSINSASRMTGVAHTTILRLLSRVGQACTRFHDAQVRNLGTLRVQCDEIWSFCYSKQKNVPEQFRGRTGYGSIWTWTALDADSKLMISWVMSDRNQAAARWPGSQTTYGRRVTCCRSICGSKPRPHDA